MQQSRDLKNSQLEPTASQPIDLHALIVKHYAKHSSAEVKAFEEEWEHSTSEFLWQYLACYTFIGEVFGSGLMVAYWQAFFVVMELHCYRIAGFALNDLLC